MTNPTPKMLSAMRAILSTGGRPVRSDLVTDRRTMNELLLRGWVNTTRVQGVDTYFVLSKGCVAVAAADALTADELMVTMGPGTNVTPWIDGDDYEPTEADQEIMRQRAADDDAEDDLNPGGYTDSRVVEEYNL